MAREGLWAVRLGCVGDPTEASAASVPTPITVLYFDSVFNFGFPPALTPNLGVNILIISWLF